MTSYESYDVMTFFPYEIEGIILGRIWEKYCVHKYEIYCDYLTLIFMTSSYCSRDVVSILPTFTIPASLTYFHNHYKRHFSVIHVYIRKEKTYCFNRYGSHLIALDTYIMATEFSNTYKYIQFPIMLHSIIYKLLHKIFTGQISSQFKWLQNQ